VIHADEQAERAVIGAVLNGATRQQVGDLRVDDFTGGREHIWACVLRLFSQGRAVDHLTLAEALKVSGRMSDAGGPRAFLGSETVLVLPAHLQQQVAVLKDRGARRRLDAEFDRRKAELVDLNLAPSRIAALASQSVLTAGGSTDDDEAGDVDLWEINDRWDAWGRMTEEERVKHAPYLPLPWEWMRDAKMYGFPANLSVVAGRSGIGKTAFLSTCMSWWLRLLPHQGGVIGLEDGTSWLDERWIAASLGINYADVGCSRLTEYQQQSYLEHMERVGPVLQKKLRKYRRPSLTATQLLTKCRRWLDDGVKWIVVDHGLRVTYEADGRLRDDAIIGKTMDALANMAMGFNAHIIVAWHLNRRAEDDEAMPQQRDLKESSYLDAAARFIPILWRKEGRTLCTVVKATKVAPVEMTCELQWKGRSGMFDTNQGRVVDFQAEARAAAEAKKAAKKENLFTVPGKKQPESAQRPDGSFNIWKREP
jgi:replicative DNA helicase